MITVLCHGCWDILHVGHIRQLKTARALGDRLVVSVCSDAHVQDSKGYDRPINKQEYRKEMLEHYQFVDEVIITEGLGSDGTIDTIKKVKPDIYVKGREHEGHLPEHDAVERIGGKVVFIDELDKDACSSSVLTEGNYKRMYLALESIIKIAESGDWRENAVSVARAALSRGI